MQTLERIQRLSPNTRGEDYVVGDIHGHFYVLERALARIGFDFERDRLLSVGDLIDRGPDSHRAPEFLAQPWFHAVRGNHEQMLLDAVGGDRVDPAMRALWYQNGGHWFEALEAEAADELIPWLAAMPYALEVALPGNGQVGIVHADLPNGDWAKAVAALTEGEGNMLEHVLWSRRRAGLVQARLDGRSRWIRRSVSAGGVDRVLFGHTPMPAAIACGNTRWLDTGVFIPGGWLSFTRLSDDSLWSFAVEGDDCSQGWRMLDER